MNSKRPLKSFDKLWVIYAIVITILTAIIYKLASVFGAILFLVLAMIILIYLYSRQDNGEEYDDEYLEEQGLIEEEKYASLPNYDDDYQSDPMEEQKKNNNQNSSFSNNQSNTYTSSNSYNQSQNSNESKTKKTFDILNNPLDDYDLNADHKTNFDRKYRRHKKNKGSSPINFDELRNNEALERQRIVNKVREDGQEKEAEKNVNQQVLNQEPVRGQHETGRNTSRGPENQKNLTTDRIQENKQNTAYGRGNEEPQGANYGRMKKGPQGANNYGRMPEGSQGANNYGRTPEGPQGANNYGRMPEGPQGASNYGRMPEGSQGASNYGRMPEGSQGASNYGRAPEGPQGANNYGRTPEGSQGANYGRRPEGKQRTPYGSAQDGVQATGYGMSQHSGGTQGYGAPQQNNQNIGKYGKPQNNSQGIANYEMSHQNVQGATGYGRSQEGGVTAKYDRTQQNIQGATGYGRGNQNRGAQEYGMPQQNSQGGSGYGMPQQGEGTQGYGMPQQNVQGATGYGMPQQGAGTQGYGMPQQNVQGATGYGMPQQGAGTQGYGMPRRNEQGGAEYGMPQQDVRMQGYGMPQQNVQTSQMNNERKTVNSTTVAVPNIMESIRRPNFTGAYGNARAFHQGMNFGDKGDQQENWTNSEKQSFTRIQLDSAKMQWEREKSSMRGRRRFQSILETWPKFVELYGMNPDVSNQDLCELAIITYMLEDDASIKSLQDIYQLKNTYQLDEATITTAMDQLLIRRVIVLAVNGNVDYYHINLYWNITDDCQRFEQQLRASKPEPQPYAVPNNQGNGRGPVGTGLNVPGYRDPLLRNVVTQNVDEKEAKMQIQAFETRIRKRILQAMRMKGYPCTIYDIQTIGGEELTMSQVKLEMILKGMVQEGLINQIVEDGINYYILPRR